MREQNFQQFVQEKLRFEIEYVYFVFRFQLFGWEKECVFSASLDLHIKRKNFFVLVFSMIKKITFYLLVKLWVLINILSKEIFYWLKVMLQYITFFITIELVGFY